MMDFKLFHIVKQRPDHALDTSTVRCPYCGSDDYNHYSTTSTAVAFNNHVWRNMQCNDCGKKFILESKGGNFWITDGKSYVLQGMPSCFENYRYDCSVCSTGIVTKHYLDENGEEKNSYSNNDTPVWQCDTCGVTIETEHRNYRPDIHHND